MAAASTTGTPGVRPRISSILRNNTTNNTTHQPMLFQSNPLSLALDTKYVDAWSRNEVINVRDGRRYRRSSLPALANLPPAVAAASVTGQHAGTPARSKASSITMLTVEDLLYPARPWREFFYQVGSYGVPTSRWEATRRLDANAVYFLKNYLYVQLACVLYALWERPRSLLGLAIAVKTWDVLREYGSDPRTDVEGFAYRATSFATMLGCWLVLVNTTVFPTISLGILMGCAVVFVHALLRRMPPGRAVGSEYDVDHGASSMLNLALEAAPQAQQARPRAAAAPAASTLAIEAPPPTMAIEAPPATDEATAAAPQL